MLSKRKWARVVIVMMMSGLVSFCMVYYKRKRRWAVWNVIPANVWEQLAAEIAGGKQPPLDKKMVLADLEAWLEGK